MKFKDYIVQKWKTRIKNAGFFTFKISSVRALFSRIRLASVTSFRRLNNLRTPKLIDIPLLSVLLLFFIYLFLLYKEKTELYLFNNLSSYKESTDFLPILFSSVGVSIVGVLAISFSLSLFSLQQAADKHTPQMLSEFLQDRMSRVIYWLLAIISIALFLLPMLLSATFRYYSLILMVVMLVFVFKLLRKQYFHIAELINPQFLLVSRYKRAIKILEAIDSELDRLIRIGAIKQGP